MSPGTRDFVADRPTPGRRDVAPKYGYAAPCYPAAAPASTWLGAPLISVAPRRPAKPTPRPDYGRQATLAKMAMQAQGAPLIIQPRYPNQRKFVPPPDCRYRRPDGRPFSAYDRCDGHDHRRHASQPAGRSANMDAVSVASDESSGSGNSEAALPRIIKPRKRRKKDRKPNNAVGAHEIASRKRDVNEDPREPRSPNNVYCALDESAGCGGDLTYFPETKQHPSGVLRNYPFSDLTIGSDANKYRSREAESVAGVCQCRYCDPTGQVWDVDGVGVSELFDESSTVDFAPTELEDSMRVVGANSKKTERKERDTTLRRSWSDPSSSHSGPNRKIGEDESAASASSVASSPDLVYSLFSSAPVSTRSGGLFDRTSRPAADGDGSCRVVPDLKLDTAVNLEVSSEIVTSLNGHRDLEIKFFSTTPPATASKTSSFFSESSPSAKVRSRSSDVCEDESASKATGPDASKAEVT